MEFLRYHRLSADHLAGTGRDSFPPEHEWPKEWKTTYYKSYLGARRINLPNVSDGTAFTAAVSGRESRRGGHKLGISQEDLSFMLKYSCGINPSRSGNAKGFRSQPSGGARFPIETYVLLFREQHGLSRGTYHYDVSRHALACLGLDAELLIPEKLFTYPWTSSCSAAIVMTAVFSRATPKYGERSYRYALLEAGHIGQGIYLSGSCRGVGVVGMGGTREPLLHRLLDIDGTTESVVYALMLTK